MKHTQHICYAIIACFLVHASTAAEMSRPIPSPERLINNSANKDKALNKAEQTRKAIDSQLTDSQQKRLLTLLNEGSDDDLAGIKGIASTRAKSIAKARPFQSIGDLLSVKGIGASTFTQVISYAKSMGKKPTKK